MFNPRQAALQAYPGHRAPKFAPTSRFSPRRALGYPKQKRSPRSNLDTLGWVLVAIGAAMGIVSLLSVTW